MIFVALTVGRPFLWRSAGLGGVGQEKSPHSLQLRVKLGLNGVELESRPSRLIGSRLMLQGLLKWGRVLASLP